MRNFPELELGVNAKTFPSRSERDAGANRQQGVARDSTANVCIPSPGIRQGYRLPGLDQRSGVRASDNGKAHMVARNTHQA